MKQRFTQYSSLFLVAAVCTVVGVAAFATDVESVDDQALRQELSTKLVEEALRREVNGQAKARDEILKQALERDSSNATARWQSGFVWDGSEWVRVDQISQSETLQARIRQYEEMRAQSAGTVAAQWQLANWCALSGLKLQERAHLYRVIQLLPDHQGARQRLGFRRINGRWQRLESIWQGLQDAQRAAQSLRTWGPRLVEVRKSLLQKNRVKRDGALSQLRALSDARAIPAVETVLTGHNPVLSQIAVDWFAARPHHQASLALIRQA